MKHLAAGLAVAVFAVGAGATDASAKPKKRTAQPTTYYSSGNPNVSYQAGPRTRIYVTKRSWLDAGTEVQPGDRKFSDYAFPPTTSFGTQNNNQTLERSPLSSTPWDLGGTPRGFPLY